MSPDLSAGGVGWLTDRQTGEGGRGNHPNLYSQGLRGIIFFLPSCENINYCFINSCQFLTYKDSQSFPLFTLMTFEISCNLKSQKISFHIHFSEGGLYYCSMLSASGLPRLAQRRPRFSGLFPKPPGRAARSKYVTSPKAWCRNPVCCPSDSYKEDCMAALKSRNAS